MKDYFYTQYISRMHHKMTDEMLDEMLSSYKNSPFIYRINITDKPYDEQTAIINKIISAERLRRFSDTKTPHFVNVIKAFDNNFYMILSLCEDKIDDTAKRMMLNVLFRAKPVTSMNLYGNEKATLLESSKYWESAFKYYRLNIPIQKRELTDDFYSESFDIPEALKPAISECIGSNTKSFKTILEVCLGKLACKGLYVDKTIISDIHDGGRLSSIPIYYDGTLSEEEQYESVKEQLIKAEYNDTCTDKMLKDVININLNTVPMINSYFMHDRKYNYFIEHMVENKVYSLDAINALSVGLTVVFQVTEDQLNVTYIYNSNVFKDVDISFVHDRVMAKLADSLAQELTKDNETDCDSINASKTDTNIDTSNDTTCEKVHDTDVLEKRSTSDPDAYIQEGNVNYNRRNQLKLSCINKIKYFASLDDKAKLWLAENSDFVAASSERHFAMPGESMDKLYFILNGSVSVMGIDRKKYLCPLYILRAGQVFGMEAMLEDKFSTVCYSVHDDKILLLQVDAVCMRKLADEHSDIYLSFMSEFRNRLYKLERLWMTV